MEYQEIQKWLQKTIKALDRDDSEQALKIAASMDEEKRSQLEEDNNLLYNLLESLSNIIKDKHMQQSS